MDGCRYVGMYLGRYVANVLQVLFEVVPRLPRGSRLEGGSWLHHVPFGFHYGRADRYFPCPYRHLAA